MEETEAELNHDFNYNLILAKSMVGTLPSAQDQRQAISWLKKLSNCGNSIDELRVRNVFAYYLVLALQDGQLQPPFDGEAPAAPLLNLHHLLPGDAYEPEPDGNSQAANEHEAPGQSKGVWGGDQPLLYENSPDGGAFLAAQPIPRCGAFCYLAVVAKQDH